MAEKENNHLHEEIEVEEVYNSSEQEARDTQDRYNERKHKYAKEIMSNLEDFVERGAEEWRPEKEEYELIDILSLVENLIKAQLSENDPNYKG